MHNDKPFVISKVVSLQTGRQARSFTLHLGSIRPEIEIDIPVKANPNSSFETVDVTETGGNFMYNDDTCLYLSNPVTFEEIAVPLSIIDSKYLKLLECI